MTANFHHFGEFEPDLSRFELPLKGLAVTLECIPVGLRILIEKDGSIVSREEIVNRLWGKMSLSTPNTASTRRNRALPARSQDVMVWPIIPIFQCAVS
jgi:DNA-binding winged helix-turn-helix (wHTH) protein